MPNKNIKLTSMSRCAGWASKLDPEVLAQVLRPLQRLQKNQKQPNLLVGLNTADDAAIYQINDEQAIISTTDFFTPVVDDPYSFGAIAAANSMSDVYAMGGEVLFALNIAGFPGNMEQDIISAIFQGGTEKVIEAGAIIAGGHTIQDEEPKYGLAVTGLVHPKKYFTKGRAKPNDILVLTKPLGTGTISTALKRDLAETTHVEQSIATMKQLNRCAAQAAQKAGNIQAVTDITGFGLLGHSMEMVNASKIQFELNFEQIPLLDGATNYASEFIFPGGASNNKLYFGKKVTFAKGISEAQQMLLWDPQTSGGLLLAIPPNNLDAFQKICIEHKQKNWIIGQVKKGVGIVVK